MTAGAQQVATVFFTNLLISVIRTVLLPLLYGVHRGGCCGRHGAGAQPEEDRHRYTQGRVVGADSAAAGVYGVSDRVGGGVRRGGRADGAADEVGHRHGGAGGGIHPVRRHRRGAGRGREC